jgi:hypothetical protein
MNFGATPVVSLLRCVVWSGRSMSPFLFLMSSEPASGKTLLGSALLLRLADLGVRAVGHKPIETGCAYTEKHNIWGVDSQALRAASSVDVPPDLICPYRLSARGSAFDALEASGLVLSAEDLAVSLKTLPDHAECVLVELPGAYDSRVGPSATNLDLLRMVPGRIAWVGRMNQIDAIQTAFLRLEPDQLKPEALFLLDAFPAERLQAMSEPCFRLRESAGPLADQVAALHQQLTQRPDIDAWLLNQRPVSGSNERTG